MAVDPPGAYCTLTVQLWPGLSTVVAVHVVPVARIVKLEPAGPAVFTTAGAAVNVSGPAVAPVAVFVTVTVPLLVSVLAGVVVNAGVGPLNPKVPPVTVKVTVLLVPPPATVTLTVWPPVVAPGGMLSVAVTCVPAAFALTPVAVMAPAPAPDTLTVVTPLRPAPLIVTGSAVFPRAPEFGVIELTNGPTVNGTVLVGGPAPAGKVTLMFLTPNVAVAEILSRAVMLVEEFTTKLPAASVTPPVRPPNPVAPVRFVPTRFTVTPVAPVLPRKPTFGVMEVSVAGATEKQPGSGQVPVPPGVVTLT
jgi:hypothetical protein